MKALISGIKRMEIHDGDGLRTTVFFKGCPLKCIWCHNPESISFKKQLAYFHEKCINCNSCIATCKENILIHRTPPFAHCSFCLDCVNSCPTNALVFYGKEYTLDELITLVLQDAPFFKNGHGGVTLSGGECLAQPEFVIAFTKALFDKGISVNIDTCGFVNREILERILPFVDTFLYDIKAFNTETHRHLTGVSNELILQNLQFLSDKKAKIEIRYPLIMKYNNEDCEQIAQYLATLHITKVKILQYHHYAASRYDALGIENTLPNTVTTFKDIEKCVRIFESYGINAINGAQ